MNRGAKAVISLALGTILMLGIYSIYRPQINSMASGSFGKIQRIVKQVPTANNTSKNNNTHNDNRPNKPVKTSFTDEDWARGVHVELASKQDGTPDQTDIPDNILYGNAKYTKDMPTFHTITTDASRERISKVNIASKSPVSFGHMDKVSLKSSDIDWNSGQVRLNNNDGQYYLVLYTKANDLSHPSD